MKEICIINYASNAAVYGIGTYLKEYVHCLSNIGCKVIRVELGTDSRKKEFYIKEEKGVKIIHIPYLHTDNVDVYNKSVCRMLRLYLKDSSDLVFHFHYLQSSSLLKGLKQCFPLSKSILTIHYLYWSAKFNGNISAYEDILKRKKHKFIQRKYRDVFDNYLLEKDFMHSVDRVICLSEDTYQLLIGLYKVAPDRLFLIPNGLATHKLFVSAERRNTVRQQYHITENEKIILFVGRINRIKGLEPLLAAFSRVIKMYPRCRLVMVGDGDIAGMLKKIPNIVTRITFTGKQDKKSLYQWYCMADIAVFPSYYEECSYVGIEMLMHGLPVIASDGYAVKNMFNSHNALIASIGSWNEATSFSLELSDEILTLLQSDELLIKKKKESLKSYKMTYHSKYMQKKYAGLLATF